MSKFEKLAEHCRKQTLNEFELSFLKIEQIIERKLLKSAYTPQYWANTVDRGSPPREALRNTPYDTFLVSGSKRVRFKKMR